MGRKLTNEEYVEKLKQNNPNVVPLEEYKGMTVKIRHKYLSCGHEAYTIPSLPLHGYNCNICAKKNVGKNFKKTNAQYVLELSELHPDIIALEEYVDSRTPILHRCLIHNYDWKASPTSMISKHGCPICANNRSMTHEEFMTALEPVKNPNVIVKGRFQNKKSKILCECSDCGHIWDATPDVLLRGNGCRKCGRVRFGLSQRKTHDVFVSEIAAINPSVTIKGLYTTAKDHIACECKICGYEWNPFADDLSMGKGCPICNASHGEREIARVLTLHGIEFLAQYTFDDLHGVGGGLLSYDFYIPHANLLIEYQGEQHCRPAFGEEQFAVQQEHDRRKKDYAKEHGIELLEIWYSNYDNIEQILNDNLNLLSVETTGIA